VVGSLAALITMSGFGDRLAGLSDHVDWNAQLLAARKTWATVRSRQSGWRALLGKASEAGWFALSRHALEVRE
jgi:hypothetical protein